MDIPGGVTTQVRNAGATATIRQQPSVPLQHWAAPPRTSSFNGVWPGVNLP